MSKKANPNSLVRECIFARGPLEKDELMRSTSFSILAVVFIAFAGCGDSDSSSEPGQTSEDWARGTQLRALADAFVLANIEPDDPGLAYAVVGPRGVIAEGAYGLANLEEELPITLETPFEVGSVAKQFTAMAVMVLIEDGLLAIDDSIANELPEAPEEWDGITIEQLLVHTSGIPSLNTGSGPEQIGKTKTLSAGSRRDITSRWAKRAPAGMVPPAIDLDSGSGPSRFVSDMIIWGPELGFLFHF